MGSIWLQPAQYVTTASAPVRPASLSARRVERVMSLGWNPEVGLKPPAIPQHQGAAVEGAALYERYGCINCHGPNGLGGVPNPQSPDKTIPPLSGPDFRKEFNTDAKIIAVVRSGSVIGRAPIVSMPCR